MTDVASIPQGLWDRFIDQLDLAGQNGCMAHVPVPALAIDLPPGRPFGELCLAIDDDHLPRTQTCPSVEDLVRVQEEWRLALETKGWTA